jgi:hypothetical protein
MIYIRLAGGLGNQLFQIAAAAHYSHTLGFPVTLLHDGLSNYRAKRLPTYCKVIADCPWLCQHSFDISTSALLFSRLRLGRIPLNGLCINDRNFLKSSSYWSMLPVAFMDGYFQTGWTSSFFFDAISTLSIVQPSVKSSDHVSGREVVVHVRGGDFLSNPQYSVVDSSFYSRCISLAVANGYEKFSFITDDPVFCSSLIDDLSAQFPGIILGILPQSDVVSDFDLLRIAPARIVGNSTFSWWATVFSLGGTTWSSPHFTLSSSKPFALPGEIFV